MPSDQMNEVADVLLGALCFLGEPTNVEYLQPEYFKGGFVANYSDGTQVQYLDWELNVSRGDEELFGSRIHGSFGGNMFSPEHLREYAPQIAEDVRGGGVT